MVQQTQPALHHPVQLRACSSSPIIGMHLLTQYDTCQIQTHQVSELLCEGKVCDAVLPSVLTLTG